ncbi:hypothetical protein M409DRAFT_28488 [Zasmidium cellare ATCC 36951]|uniref:Uncharacterized protein n=1 Tax=Zasmidium cellare ATCC 36951 TaxID=1080233 RepID=A0A6A6C4Q3_ZASCE|nr:uncharacterized protein M409DRAFT_28488 [Zasmidium cellare ATCC 36951]KAF2161160.1 hypothetical protein M409DRAFT_28488 [Zasmidium cellare ATCC 36951]
MSQDNGHIVAHGKNSPVNKRNNNREARIELPFHMRNRFLQETSHLPLKVFRHLESYIKPTSPPTTSLAKKKPVTSNPPPATSTTINMELRPDLYAEAEILKADHEHDPQRESSSAAASRAQSNAKHSSSPSSKYSSDLVQSPVTDPDDAPGPRPEPFVYKANPTAAICRLHEFSYSSQYTRPASELLQEILEVRYPLEREGDDEERALLGGVRSRSSSRERSSGWWRKLTGALWAD